jgi:Lrp/AsnC family leucine-responsive transcriptional regulator
MIKPVEKKILLHLRENSRVSLTELSRKISVPVSTIFDKLKKLKGEVILKNTTLYDFARLGCPIKVNYAIKTNEGSRNEVREFLLNSPSVNSVFRTNNGTDFYVDALFRDLKEAEEFSNGLAAMGARHDSFYIIEELKREEFFTPANEVV